MTTDKTSVAYRLSAQALDNLETITRATGSTKTAAVEMALALLAEKFKGENEMMRNRNILISRFMSLYVGDMEELDTMSLDALESMIDELEQAQAAGDLNLETDAGVAKLQEIVERYTTSKSIDDLMDEFGSNVYAIEDRGSGSANDPNVLLLYDEDAKLAVGELELTFDGHRWISTWQNPNTRGEYDYRIIFPL
jgi:hypothetical protein